MVRSFLVVSALLTSITGASAKWLIDSEESAFDDTNRHMALVTHGPWTFGMRCQPSQSSDAVFLTPRRADAAKLKAMNSAEPRLSVRVDKSPIAALNAELLATPENTILVHGSADVSLYKSIRDARSSVSVALTVSGKNLFEAKFDVRGSKPAMNKLIVGCKLDPDTK